MSLHVLSSTLYSYIELMGNKHILSVQLVLGYVPFAQCRVYICTTCFFVVFLVTSLVVYTTSDMWNAGRTTNFLLHRFFCGRSC